MRSPSFIDVCIMCFSRILGYAKFGKVRGEDAYKPEGVIAITIDATDVVDVASIALEQDILFVISHKNPLGMGSAN